MKKSFNKDAIKEKNHISKEVEQSLVRIALVGVILVYSLSYTYYLDKEFIAQHIKLLSAFVSISILEYLLALYCSSLPDMDIRRTLFKVATNVVDNGLLALAMILMGHAGTPLFLLFLWITFGIGIRYGAIYLLISALLNIVAFGFVIYYSPIWHNSEILLLSFGLIIAFMVLPGYVYVLILKLSKALESERNANQVKQSFLANINHELRTPLNSILSLSQMIKAYYIPDKVYNMVRMISTSAYSQLQIINSILDISKIEAGEFYLNKNIFKLPSLVHEVQQIILPQALNKNIDFDVYLEAECSQMLEGASDQIKQILVNLLGNAVKFTESGSVDLAVYSTYSSDNEQGLAFEIRDTGIGIAHEAQEKIFKPFVQGDASITRKYGGTGLGIAISSELSKLMGGSLTLESEENIGTTFLFKLSLDKPILSDNYVPVDFKIFIYFVNDEYQHIKEFYKEQGFDVTGIENVAGKDLEELFNKRLIIIVDGINYDNLPESIRQFIADYHVPIVAVCDNSELNSGNMKPLTSIRPDSSSIILLNAISVCVEFLDIHDEIKITIPEPDKSLNILIAEDDPTLGEINRILFSNLNHRVDIISDGIEALAALTSNKYDIAILDLHMPGMSGLDVAKQYKSSAKTRGIPIILLTADIYMIKANENDLSLFNRVLVKPISPLKLMETICDCLSLSRGHGLLKINELQNNIRTQNRVLNIESSLNYGIINNHIALIGVNKLIEIIEIYDCEVRAQLKELRNFLYKKDTQKVNSILHRLQGLSNSIGAISFGNIVINYVEGFSDVNDHATTQKYNNLLISSHEKFLNELKQYLFPTK